jgi:hypothetical protein
MFRFGLRDFQYAGLVICAILLASTPDLAQQIRGSVEPPHSIVSLAPTPRPEGGALARLPGDATFERAPANYHVFAAASVDTDAGVEVLTLQFAAATRLTRIESKNKDFVIEPGGTCREGNSYARGGACSLLVRFSPQGPGHRLGFINVTHSTEATPMSFGLVGNGYAAVVSFTPSTITTVPGTVSGTAGTISGATNMTVDGGDIVYIADIGNDLIKEIDSTGAVNTLTPFFPTPASLAVDNLGIIYSANTSTSSYYFSFFMPWGSQTAYGNTYAGGTCTPSTPCPLGTVGMNRPANMSIDAYDDLFFEEGTKGAAEMPVANISGGTGSFNLWYLTDQFNYTNTTPASFAVDAYDNIYNNYTYTVTNTCFLLEESLYAAEYSPTANRVAGGVHCGFSGDGGLARGAEISSTIGQIAFDPAGDLYFADAGNQRIRRIDAATGIINTIAGNGIAGYTGDGGRGNVAEIKNPTGVAVDSSGQVYFISSATTNQVVRKLTTQGNMTFNTQAMGTTSSARIVTVTNTGNYPLVLGNYAFTGSNPGDFSIYSPTTSCILTPGATLPSGQSCKIGFQFKPAALGARSANLVLNDNTVTSVNTIVLTGTGISQASFSPASLVFISTTAGTKATLSLVLTNIGGAPLSVSGITFGGANASLFSDTNNCTTSAIAIGGSCTIQVSFSPTAAGSFSGTVLVADSAVGSPQSVSITATAIAAAVSRTTTTLESSANPATACGEASFFADVVADDGTTPTGTVQLMSGSTVLAKSLLSKGAASFPAPAMAAGTYSLMANYSGDATHMPSTSTAISQSISPGGSCRPRTPNPPTPTRNPVVPIVP